MGIVIAIIIGALSGWLAGIIMRGGGFGFIINTVIGLIGGVVGGFLLKFIGIQSSNFIGEIIVGAIGAIVLLFVLSLFKE